MRISMRDYLIMTMREIENAIAGYRKKEDKDLEWALYNTRLISYYTYAPHCSKRIKPSDLFGLEIDKELKKQKLKSLKPIKIVQRAE